MDFLVHGIKVEMGFDGIKIFTNDPNVSKLIYKYLEYEGFIRENDTVQFAE